MRGKPAPDTYLRAAELLDMPPSHCLALEDAPNGVRSAKAAGMACFAVPNHGTQTHDFSAADAVLASLGDVLAELESRRWLPVR
jgi:beta-phosphoglucomutase-like phosphatase (HAD superfamily)